MTIICEKKKQRTLEATKRRCCACVFTFFNF